MSTQAPPPGLSPNAAMEAETNGARLKAGEIKPEQFILDGTLLLLSKLNAEMVTASSKHLLDVGKLWMTTANGVLRARRRLKDK